MKEFQILVILILVLTFVFICLATFAELGIQTVTAIGAAGAAIATAITRYWPFEKSKPVQRKKRNENPPAG